ncbi:MAG: DUF535 family protein [Neisseria sp.]|nr:DUF535 family protein [Neisseria sp.]
MMNFAYPPFKTFYRNAGYFSEQFLKFSLRRRLFAGEVAVFERFVNESRERQQFFARDPSETYPLLHTFIDKRFTAKQRLAAMQYDLQTALQHFGANIWHKMCAYEPVKLADLSDELSVWLSRNGNHVAEGWWAVSLRNNSGERLYSATFAFLVPNSLLMASVQGPAGENSRDTVRALTKKLHGLRPQQLLPQVVQKLAEIWRIQQILGITQANQVKLRWKLKKRVTMNYDDFWQEAQAEQHSDGYWHLPPTAARKAEAEIESKKRSMYRKRYAMLDGMFEQIAANIAMKNG